LILTIFSITFVITLNFFQSGSAEIFRIMI